MSTLRLGVLFLVTVLVVLAASGCGPGPVPTGPEMLTPTFVPPAPTSAPSAPIEMPVEAAEQEGQEAPFELTSTAFASGETIPQQYTCDGDDVSPPLAWSDPPPGTQSFALIADDPDAPVGTWVHWVLYNLPAEARALPEAIPAGAELADGSRHGKNGWGRPGYGGPCPPSGTHRYFFRLYALDTALNLAAGASNKQVLQAMEGHVLAETELMGIYTRQ